MTRAIGPLSVAGGSELQTPTQPAIPVQFSPLGGGDWDEDRASRARRRRLRWQCVGGAAFALAVAALVLVIVSLVYEARSSVLIRPPGGNLVPQAIDGALQSEVEILQSFEVLRQAIESVGVDVLYPGLERESLGATLAAAIGRVREALAVRTLPGSDVIEVTFRHASAEMAAEIVRRLVERYQLSRRETLAPATSERFLQERIEEQRAALVAAEAALAAFHTEHPAIASRDPRGSLTDRRVTTEAELRSLREAIDAARSAGNSEDPSVGRARTRLDELELELQRTLNTHVESSRAVSTVRQEIGLVRDYLADKERTATQEQGRRLELLRKRQSELEARLAELGQGERDLPELERKGRELARERDVVARRLDSYQRELEAATLAADVDEHQVALAVRILERAHAPTTAIVPEERAHFAWALVGAALLALVGAFVTDWLEQRRTQHQPMVWTAHVGAGGEGGSVALLMPHQRQGPGSGPVVLLLSGAGEGNGGQATPGSGASAGS